MGEPHTSYDGPRLCDLPPLHLPQHPNENCPEHSVLLTVDQQLGEGSALRVAPELADPLGAFEVGLGQQVKEFGACSRIDEAGSGLSCDVFEARRCDSSRR